MAYSTANLATGQAKLISGFQNGELRVATPVTFQKYLQSAPIMYPDYETLRTDESRTVTAYYKRIAARSLGSARSHNHTGAQATAGSLTPTWTIYTDLFVNYLKQGGHNVYDRPELITHELYNVFRNFAIGTETAAIAHAFNNRSHVNDGDGIEGDFDGTNYVFEIGSSKEKRGLQIIQSIMDLNDWGGELIVFCDTLMYNKLAFYAAQGVANNENLSFQFGGVTFVHSKGLYALMTAVDEDYTLGTCIAVQNGMIACLPHIPKENKAGIKTTVNEYATVMNPFDNLDYALHMYEERASGASYDGQTQDVKSETQISIDLAFDYSPLSTSGETPLQAFAIVEDLVN